MPDGDGPLLEALGQRAMLSLENARAGVRRRAAPRCRKLPPLFPKVEAVEAT